MAAIFGVLNFTVCVCGRWMYNRNGGVVVGASSRKCTSKSPEKYVLWRYNVKRAADLGCMLIKVLWRFTKKGIETSWELYLFWRICNEKNENGTCNGENTSNAPYLVKPLIRRPAQKDGFYELKLIRLQNKGCNTAKHAHRTTLRRFYYQS